MSASRSSLLILVALASLFAISEEVMADSDRARRAARTVEALVSRNDYQTAERTLSAVDCESDANCQALVEFSYGWLYECWADSAPDQAGAFLTQALSHYQSAQTANPNNTQILTNLALVAQRTGDAKTAAAAIAMAIKVNPDRAYENYLFLGDVLRSAGDDAGALGAYKQAMELVPADPQGYQRLLELYRKTQASKDLFELSYRIRHRFAELASAGFESAIALDHKDHPDSAERALPLWTAIRADLGSLTAANLESLPKPAAWAASSLGQLYGVIQSDDAPPDTESLGWWLQKPVRRDAMARLLRLKGNLLRSGAERSDVGQQERLKAERIAIEYLSTAVHVAPDYGAYLHGALADSSNVKLDAATDLVSLHHALKNDVDPQGLSGVSENELENMTEMLFSGKAGAYATGQLSAIQRYHTVLGMIYYETGRDTSNWADNATFQLSHALQTAARIADRNPAKYQPLPELQLLLADVYQRREMLPDSAKQSLSAAMGFLETDNLAAANNALARAQQNGADIERTASVSRILNGRQAIALKGAALLQQQPDTGSVTLSPEVSWLEESSALGLPKIFVAGQRFKALADLGAALTDKGNNEVARYLNAMALDAATNRQTLTSPTDLRRLKSIETSIAGTARLAPISRSMTIERAGETAAEINDKQMWALPVGTGNAVFQIDKDLLEKSKDVAKQEQFLTKPQIKNVDQQNPPTLEH